MPNSPLPTSPTSPRPVRRGIRLRAILLALTAALGLVAATSNQQVTAVTTTATSMVIVDANVTGVVKPDAPWAQPPFMVSGALHTVTVNFFNGTTPAPLSTAGKGTALTFAIVDGTTTTNLKTYTVPPNVTTFTVTDLPTAAPANNVQLKATAATSPRSPIIAFLSLSILKSYLNNDGGNHTLSSIGGKGSGLDSSCEATAQQPFCADVVLPAGASQSGGNVILALGSCTGLCNNPLSFLELLISVDPTVVTATNPVKVYLKCDKTVCPGDPKNYPAFVQLSPDAAEVVATPCQTKGVIDPGLDFCSDESSSIKNGAGDFVRLVLFKTDPRTRLGG